MILHRATFQELIPAFLLTLSVLTAMVMMEKAYRLVSLAVEKSFTVGDVGRMLLYILPQGITVTLPMAVVGAVFITVIRQSLDAEVISRRAAGSSMWRYAVPFAVFGLLLTAVHLLFTLWLLPAGNQAYSELQVQVVKARADEQIVPGRLNTDFGGKLIRVGERHEDREFSDIFVADQDLSLSPRMVLADRGRIEVDEAAQQVIFRLHDGVIYAPGADNIFDQTRFNELNYVLAFQAEDIAIPSVNWRISTWDLVQELRTRDANYLRRSRRSVELVTRILTPWICLAFALAAMPMAISEPRSGRVGSLARALMLILAYYVIWITFLDLAQSGRVTPLVLVLPPLMILVYGLLRISQQSRDIHLRFWLRQLWARH